MLWEALGAARDLGRLHDIASILVRYGFSDLVQRLGMAGALERAGRVLKLKHAAELARLTPAARVRRALEDMGPTFIKLGQILATRVDLFPPEWIAEFERLQDRAPALPFEQLLPQLKEDLGADPRELFAELDTQALAAASIAQVHRACLPEGRQVVLKIRRPGIRPVVEADLRLLNRMADIAENELPELRRFRLKDVLRQFTLSLRRELDFADECRSAERVARGLAGDETIVIPTVHWAWTGERLNVQDYIDGIPGRDIASVAAAGLDRRLLARRGAQAVLTMILINGFFHADPHPGNVFYLPGNRLAFIDFGMVGRLAEGRRGQVIELLSGMVERDAQQVTEVLLEWAGDVQVDVNKLVAEVDNFVDHYHGLPLGQLDLADMLRELTALLRDHQLALPPDLALLFKTFITLEGFGRLLDPDFDMIAEARPFVQRAMVARYAPDALVKRGRRAMLGLAELFTGLPQDFRRLVRAARRGSLQVHVDVTRLDDFGERLDRAASRLTVGIVTAALIVGTAIVMTIPGGGDLVRWLGFIGAAAGGLWVLISVWRSGRER
ncbi:MAG TPA: ubiquinone biosynthesis protein UbiB [Anaerolineae bacterium]|nr:ubiquinone biosynthesis protein UbiB [Anaerolineae bacterium]